MNIDVHMAADGYKTLLLLNPDLYDGHPPIDSISYQTRVRVLDPNVYAVSAAITMQNYVAESLSYHLPLQVHVADAIEAFFSNRKLRVGPLEQEPAMVSVGNRQAVIGGGTESSANHVNFCLGDSHSFTSFATIDTVLISSNVACFFPNNKKGKLLSTIAAAVMFAPDYAFGGISLAKDCAKLLDNSEYLRYRALLSSINIKLSKEDFDE